MKKKLSIALPLICCALIAHAQDTPPDSSWDTDPLDILESKEPAGPTEVDVPNLPEFTEVPGDDDFDVFGDAPTPAETPATPSPAVEEEPAFVESSPTPVVEESRFAESTPTSTFQNEPDYSKETQFHRIYKTYNEQPTSVEVWEQAVGTRASEIYKVEKGDTLSGISTTFFGDFSFWPKIWALNNNQILNPHEILPGMAVVFYPGTMEEAPTLGLGPAGSPLIATNTLAPEASASRSNSLAGIELPPARPRTPLLKQLPGSLPQYSPVLPTTDSSFLSLDLGVAKLPKAYEYLGYYLNDAPLQGVGTITGTEAGSVTASDYQMIFVQIDSAPTGKDYVVQKNLTTVPDPKKGKRKGHMVEIQGQIELLDQVNPEKNIYRAMIKKTLAPIQVGSIVTPGNLAVMDPEAGEIVSGVSAAIMGGQFERDRVLFGSSSIVFLDAGSDQGIQVGQNLAVFADERIRNKKSGATTNDRVIGALKIVKVSNSFATALVVKATDDISIGDYVGSLASVARSGVPASSGSDFDDFDSEGESSDVPSDTPSEVEGLDSESGNDDFELEL